MIWGTHVEITAAAAFLNKPVFVAIRKGELEFFNYYWAKYFAKSKEKWVYPADSSVTTDLHHLEICHENGHYDIVLTAPGGLFPSSPPYDGESCAFVDIY